MLHTDTTHGVATLLIERRERGNALSAPLVEALLAALDHAFDDQTVHTVLIAGDGPHLCTGFDLDGLGEASDGDLLWRFVRIEMLLAKLWHAPVRTAALACGRTWGAGADLFATCDLRLAAAGATFRFPGAGFGLVLGTRRLAERVGADRARQWVTEATALDANEALAAGLASEGWSRPGTDGNAAGGHDAGAPADGAALAPGIALRLGQAPAVDRETLAALRRATREDRRDADLAALVRSAARPGLQARISAYRDRLRGAARRE
jgi:enoyl-CoA hydratase